MKPINTQPDILAAVTDRPAHNMEHIAQTILNIDTLATRHRDTLDFYDLAVWEIKKALEAVYVAGQAAGRNHTECRMASPLGGRRAPVPGQPMDEPQRRSLHAWVLKALERAESSGTGRPVAPGMMMHEIRLCDLMACIADSFADD